MLKSPRYVVLDKKIGETPLATLELFRKTEPRLAKLPMTYAGRLDPMASGELIVLVGEECKKRDRYTSYDKAYEFEILLGATTDTGDVLGLPQISDSIVVSDEEVESALQMFVGKSRTPYPAFSSKTVEGKPLFQHALEGSLGDIEIPETETRIYKLTYLGKRDVPAWELLHAVEKKIEALKIDTESTKLGADFRKDEIRSRWQQLLGQSNQTFTVVKCEAIVSSGTYIRTLAHAIAQKLGTEGLAFSIHRFKIGRFRALLGNIGLWTKVF